MFDGKYFEWNQKRIKGIVDFYGYKFFYFKRLLDLGCGYGDLGGVLYRLGADVTAIDARQEHLKILSKKFPGIKTTRANLDGNWPFHGQKFDIILDLALMCHLDNYEKHLQEVCTSTTHLVLETAVCDSDDPYKVIPAPENKGVYDLSFNGMGCRPSPPAVERILRECGMNFKRLDNAKFNSDEYKYDWYPVNDNSTSLYKRRIWFAVKDSSPIQFANPNSEIAMPPISAPAERGYITPVVNSGIPVTASPKPPMSARMEAEARNKANAVNPQITSLSMPQPSPIRTRVKAQSLINRVREDSRQFNLITPDDFQTQNKLDTRAIILPTTNSSRMWFKKIAPLFPQFKLSGKVLSMPHFEKSGAAPDLVMCSLDNLQAHNRVFIDEWMGPALQEAHIEVLQKCAVIVTPSLHNAQEIWKHIPNAGVIRVEKPWPAVEVQPVEGNYYLYFEKSAELTDILLKSWDPQLGNIVMVGASVKLPDYVTYVSDSEPYSQIMKYILGATALIDLSENNYYASGLVSLAADLNLPVISNNHAKWNDQFTLIHQDRKVSLLPTTDNVRQAIVQFMGNYSNKPNAEGIKAHNENHLVNVVRKMVGA